MFSVYLAYLFEQKSVAAEDTSTMKYCTIVLLLYVQLNIYFTTSFPIPLPASKYILVDTQFLQLSSPAGMEKFYPPRIVDALLLYGFGMPSRMLDIDPYAVPEWV
ncbi:hypothetical protein T07_3625 [Trichinella nelsoni]|uniref:Uncharacterized protein n=3 Tax=Trichinella TaxID=6333 RepID=A0A0V0RTM3_9BILA|nr:hypothetical protein T07_3625 [Trichinella nelsoni]KRY43513.1 hypothetical protein T01_15952 [Trichinella spiralis]